MKFNLEIWISVGALVISLISFVVAFWQRREADITGVKPTLVFVFDNESGWKLQNIGNGPALNVIVAEKPPEGDWFNPVRIPPIAKDGEFTLCWIALGNPNGLGTTYNDIRNRPYTTTSGNDYSRIIEGRELPAVITVDEHPRFKDSEIGVHWVLPDRRRDV